MYFNFSSTYVSTYKKWETSKMMRQPKKKLHFVEILCNYQKTLPKNLINILITKCFIILNPLTIC